MCPAFHTLSHLYQGPRRYSQLVCLPFPFFVMFVLLIPQRFTELLVGGSVPARCSPFRPVLAQRLEVGLSLTVVGFFIRLSQVPSFVSPTLF